MVLNPKMRLCHTTGITECPEYMEGMNWLMNSLLNCDTKETNAKKNDLKNMQKFAGLTTEEKF